MESQLKCLLRMALRFQSQNLKEARVHWSKVTTWLVLSRRIAPLTQDKDLPRILQKSTTLLAQANKLIQIAELQQWGASAPQWLGAQLLPQVVLFKWASLAEGRIKWQIKAGTISDSRRGQATKTSKQEAQSEPQGTWEWTRGPISLVCMLGPLRRVILQLPHQARCLRDLDHQSQFKREAVSSMRIPVARGLSLLRKKGKLHQMSKLVSNPNFHVNFLDQMNKSNSTRLRSASPNTL